MNALLCLRPERLRGWLAFLPLQPRARPSRRRSRVTPPQEVPVGANAWSWRPGLTPAEETVHPAATCEAPRVEATTPVPSVRSAAELGTAATATTTAANCAPRPRARRPGHHRELGELSDHQHGDHRESLPHEPHSSAPGHARDSCDHHRYEEERRHVAVHRRMQPTRVPSALIVSTSANADGIDLGS